jgi:hypothetical protein
MLGRAAVPCAHADHTTRAPMLTKRQRPRRISLQSSNPELPLARAGRRPWQNVSGTAVRDRDPPIGDFFQKAESDLSPRSTRRTAAGQL